MVTRREFSLWIDIDDLKSFRKVEALVELGQK